MTPTSRNRRICFWLGMLLIGVLCLALAVAAHSQGIYSCESIAASMHKDWKPLYAAPHDGTIVEVLNTYGVAPTYGLFEWSTTAWWREVDPGHTDNMLMGEMCMFYRPYAGKVSEYIDPTHGAQYHTEYWCKAMRRPYNKKEDKCE